MKRRCAMYFAVLFVFASYVAFAQQSEEERQREEKLRKESAFAEIQREELLNLQKETVRALQLHNSSFFSRVYSDDFIGTSPTGNSRDKEALLAWVQTSSVKYSSFVVSDIRIRIFQSTAVVTCLWSSRGSAKGEALFQQSRVINVYVYGSRGWQAVASQETQLPG